MAIFLIAHLATADVTRVACVGDNITYGYGLRDREANAYPVWLGRWLGTNYDVRNFGVSTTTLLHRGDYPYIVRPAYTNALDFKADIVIIDFGANDSKHPGDGSLDSDNAVNNWQHKGDFIDDYKTMIAAFRQSNPAAKIFICHPTPDFPGRWGINDKTIRDEMIPMIRTVAEETGAGVIDLRSALAGRSGLFPDTVHPNNEGSRLMAAEIYRTLMGQSPPEEKPRRARRHYNVYPPYYAWNNNFSGQEIGWYPGTNNVPQSTAGFNFKTNSLYGYPASARGWHYGFNPANDDLFPKKLTEITNLYCGFSYNCGGEDLHGDFAYDLFLRHDARKSVPQLEVMVWAGNNSYPIGRMIETNITVADSISFDLWAGTNSGAGYYVYSFAPHEKTEILPTVGHLNVDMMQFLRLLDGRDYFSMDMYLDVVEAGFEVVRGRGWVTCGWFSCEAE